MNKPLFEVKSEHVQTFHLSAEVVEELNTLHAQGQDVNEILLKLLAGRRERIQEEKERLAEEVQPANSTSFTRYIPVKTRRVLKEEFGQKCAIDMCAKPSEEIHHTRRFSLSRSHDPHFLAPLCQGHHQLAHAVDVKVRDHWKLTS